MNQAAYTLFKTRLGTCGIAWSEGAGSSEEIVVTAFQLPEATAKLTEAEISRKASARRAVAAPGPVKAIIAKVQKHLDGEAQDFRDIPVDPNGAGVFAREVYEAARRIPAGRTMTYGELAKAIDRPAASRAIGQALGRNPIPLLIPCHRVLATGNRMGGFSAHGGIATKTRMLAIEGASPGPPPTIKSPKDLRRMAELLGKKDRRLGRMLSRPIEFRLKPEHSPYETLIEAVVHQQLSPKAAATIFGRVKALYAGARVPSPAALLSTPDERLRSAGLSRSKARAVKDIAAKAADGIVPTAKEIVSLGDEEIIKRLTSIHGVGQWTVEMMLIFTLGRTDVLPVDDYAIRKSVGRLYGMKSVPTPKQVKALGEAWTPYRTVASLYLWNAIKNDN